MQNSHTFQDDDDNSSEHFADYFHEQFYGDDNANGARVDRKVYFSHDSLKEMLLKCF